MSSQKQIESKEPLRIMALQQDNVSLNQGSANNQQDHLGQINLTEPQFANLSNEAS